MRKILGLVAVAILLAGCSSPANREVRACEEFFSIPASVVAGHGVGSFRRKTGPEGSRSLLERSSRFGQLWQNFAMQPLAPGDPQTIGNFVIQSRLGSGGMGVVYLATRGEETLALKVLREATGGLSASPQDLSREVQTLAAINHPSVAKVVDFGLSQGTTWFATEYIKGPNLAEHLRDNGPLTELEWWELAKGLLAGLDTVHKSGVIHRDIKPANIILSESGPKLIDFGIARFADVTSITATGFVAGTPAWFSPEQIEGLPLTYATDVFSAGSVLVFAATGAPPWGRSGETTKASVLKILTSEPDLEGLTLGQQELVSRMLVQEQSQRPSAGALVDTLEDYRDGTATIPIVSNGGGPKPQLLTGILVAGSLLVTTGVGAFLLPPLISPTYTLAVFVSSSYVSSNPPIGDYHLELRPGDGEIVQVSLNEALSPIEAIESFEWGTEDSLSIVYQPPFSQDEAWTGLLSARDVGLRKNDFDQLYIHVDLSDQQTVLSFRSQDDPVAEVFSITLARDNGLAARETCIQNQTNQVLSELSGYQTLFDRYEEALRYDNLSDGLDRYGGPFAGRGGDEGYGTRFSIWPAVPDWIRRLTTTMNTDLEMVRGSSNLGPLSSDIAAEVEAKHAALVDQWNVIPPQYPWVWSLSDWELLTLERTQAEEDFRTVAVSLADDSSDLIFPGIEKACVESVK